MSPRRRVSARELAPLVAGWKDDRAAGYAALADRLRLLVLDGRVPVHALLPSERELAVALGTSRTTTAAAYRLLRAHRPLTLGFGVTVFVSFLIPLGAILLMPAAVAGAALLTRRALGQPIDIVTVPARL